MFATVFSAVSDFAVGAGLMWVYLRRPEWATGAFAWAKAKAKAFHESL